MVLSRLVFCEFVTILVLSAFHPKTQKEKHNSHCMTMAGIDRTEEFKSFIQARLKNSKEKANFKNGNKESEIVKTARQMVMF